MSREPAALGLDPEGDSIPDMFHNSFINPGQEGYAGDMSVADAIKTPTFWILTLSIIAVLFTITIPFVFLVSYAKSIGLSDITAATFISVIGIAAMVGNLSMGAVSDWIGRKVAFGFALFLGMCAFAGFAQAKPIILLYASLAAFGLYYGAVAVLFPGLVGDFFGRANAGTLTGTIFALGGPAGALGPIVAGYIYDITRQYPLAFLLSALVNAVALGIFTLAREPKC